MTEQELQQKIQSGKAKVTDNVETPPTDKPIKFSEFDFITEMLRKPKVHLTAAPTFIPKNFLEQIQFYDDTTDQRIYFFVNGSWYYVALTS